MHYLELRSTSNLHIKLDDTTQESYLLSVKSCSIVRANFEDTRFFPLTKGHHLNHTDKSRLFAGEDALIPSKAMATFEESDLRSPSHFEGFDHSRKISS